MGFLQEFFQNVFQQSPAFRQTTQNEPRKGSDWDSLSPFGLSSLEEELENQSNPAAEQAFGDFFFTDAVRPSINARIEPVQGYRHDTYVDEESGATVPVVMAAANRDILFPLFIELIQKLGETVDVVLESSHDHSSVGHVDFFRDQIDTPVLVSALWDYEDLLLNDGCTGIAVLNPNIPQEVQFDEHKLLIVYGSPLEPYEFLMESSGVRRKNNMPFITEADHVHTSSEEFRRQFDQLRTQLGIDADFGSANQQPPGELNF